MSSDDRPPSVAPKTVLVVEDDALIRRLFSDLLDQHGYVILTTSSGKAAVELAQQRQPNLIVLDIQLPDISGMEVARQLKASKETRIIPIIAVTAFAMSGDRAKILASGCDDYLAKPFRSEEFIRMIERYMT